MTRRSILVVGCISCAFTAIAVVLVVYSCDRSTATRRMNVEHRLTSASIALIEYVGLRLRSGDNRLSDVAASAGNAIQELRELRDGDGPIFISNDYDIWAVNSEDQDSTSPVVYYENPFWNRSTGLDRYVFVSIRGVRSYHPDTPSGEWISVEWSK